MVIVIMMMGIIIMNVKMVLTGVGANTEVDTETFTANGGIQTMVPNIHPTTVTVTHVLLASMILTIGVVNVMILTMVVMPKNVLIILITPIMNVIMMIIIIIYTMVMTITMNITMIM